LHLLAGLACLAMFACGAVRAAPQVSSSHSADRSRQVPVPFTLTLDAALRSALEAGSAARAGQLDRQQQRALWVFAQAEFSPSFSLTSEARRQWIRGVPGAADEANMTAGTGWRLPSGAQIDLRLIQDLARTAGTTTRPVTRDGVGWELDLGEEVIRFVPPVDADGTGVVGIELVVDDVAEVRERARTLNLINDEGDILIGGVVFRALSGD
jgi:hypothetical protein